MSAAPDFKSIVQHENNLAILPLSLFEDSDAKQTAAQKQAQLETLEKRFATLGIPVILDRSADEKTLQGKAEWVKIYAVLYGAEENEEKAFAAVKDSFSKDESQKAEKENKKQENHAKAFLYTFVAAAALILAAAVMGIQIKKRRNK